MVDIQSLFNRIQQPTHVSDNTYFIAISIPEYPHLHLAKDADNFPLLLITVSDIFTKSSTPPITLEHLSVIFDVPCRISNSEGKTIESIFTVVRCT